MANQIQLLYEPKDKDKVFDYLVELFGKTASEVQVEAIIKDVLTSLSWSGFRSSDDVALELTEAFPQLVIETPSTTGMDLHSRYFNGAQLW